MLARSGSRTRAAAVLVVLVLGLSTAGTWSAAAADCILGLLGQCDTTTTAPPAPGEPPPDAGQPAPPGETPPPGEGPITLPPPAQPVPPPDEAAPTGPDGPLPPGEGDDAGAPPADAGPFPENLQRQMNSVRRTGPNDTGALIEALAPLGQYGVTPEEAALIGFGRFPVAGKANYTHDWWFPRFGPGWRLHMGTDIFAAMGTPVRAPSDGTVRTSNGGLGGLSVYVVEPNGTFWYLAHLAGIAEGVTNGTTVTVGQVVGFVGDSGNARGGSPHVHAEFHPGGGGAVDPKAALDEMLSDAIADAPALIQRYADAAAANTVIPSPPVPSAAGGGVGPFETPRSALLYASAMNPSGGALALAEAEAARVAKSLDWDVFQARQVARSEERSIADRQVAAWLTPLIPPLLAAMIGQPPA